MLAEYLGLSVTQCALANHSFNKTNCFKSQIYCAKKPMGYAYGTPGVVGHVVVIKGYVSVGNTNYVVLNDPWSPCQGAERLLEYTSYADPPGTATHWNTWYGIAKK